MKIISWLFTIVTDGDENFEKILQFVLFNPSEVNSNSFGCLPLENIVTDEEVTSTVKKIVSTEEENDNDRKILSSARRGRPRLKPVTGMVLKERRNVSLFFY